MSGCRIKDRLTVRLFHVELEDKCSQCGARHPKNPVEHHCRSMVPRIGTCSQPGPSYGKSPLQPCRLFAGKLLLLGHVFVRSLWSSMPLHINPGDLSLQYLLMNYIFYVWYISVSFSEIFGITIIRVITTISIIARQPQPLRGRRYVSRLALG